MLRATLARLHREEAGHLAPTLATLLGAPGALLLAVGAAANVDVVTIIGGIVLALALVAAGALAHSGVDYPLERRLDELERR